jgi:hypothetical protein
VNKQEPLTTIGLDVLRQCGLSSNHLIKETKNELFPDTVRIVKMLSHLASYHLNISDDKNAT